eukprot:CAMPEP_0117825420 /NCGR_PEP_ID=MMETSP0949-20121206/5474_1 /TAXON_ID=44440 /ORGANISM="Chattonella subsalsa, Strain CCMP2191" /LENGTH=597 /DNA_ID=CAMNT_0005665405 /DNA_START=443 /DNA_END=2236 /DNA_ORIENTATION=+
MNPIGFTLNGVALYGPAINSYGGDAVKHEIDTFDWCGGHADPDGIEHYHSEPHCVAEAAKRHPEDGMINPGNNHSVMYGWISDGFPVYGPYGDGGVVPTDLDECQGHYGDSGAGGGYHYHYSGPTGAYQYDSFNGSGYPYFLACFKGCIASETENSVSIAQDDPYAVCKSSGTKAPTGNYSADFFAAFKPLNYSFIEEEFVYADTAAPTGAPTPAPTMGCSMYVTTSDSAGDGWNGYVYAIFASNDHAMSTSLQNVTLSSGSSGATCLDLDADTCYKFAEYISGSKGLEIGWDLCGHSGSIGSFLSFCTDSDGLYGNCTAMSTNSPTATAATLSPTTASPTLSPTTESPTATPTASPTLSPTTASPTATPTASPTLSPTTASPTLSPTTSPTAYPTPSPTILTTSAPTTGEYTCDFTVSMVGVNETAFTDKKLADLEYDMATEFDVHPSQVSIGSSSHFVGMGPPPEDAGFSSSDDHDHRHLSSSGLTNSTLNCTVNGLSSDHVESIFDLINSLLSNGTFDAMLEANGIPPPRASAVATFTTVARASATTTDDSSSTDTDSTSEDNILTSSQPGQSSMGNVFHMVSLLMALCFLMIK